MHPIYKRIKASGSNVVSLLWEEPHISSLWKLSIALLMCSCHGFHCNDKPIYFLKGAISGRHFGKYWGVKLLLHIKCIVHSCCFLTKYHCFLQHCGTTAPPHPPLVSATGGNELYRLPPVNTLMDCSPSLIFSNSLTYMQEKYLSLSGLSTITVQCLFG